MSLKRMVGWTCLALLSVAFAAPARAQAERGKAEMTWGTVKLAAPFEIAK